MTGVQTCALPIFSREFAVLTPRPGLVWPLGGKYTTARCDAVEIVDAVYGQLGRPAPDSRSDAIPLPGAPQELRDLGDFTGWQAEAMAGLARHGFDADTARSLTLRHGTGIRRVEALIAENPAWRQRIHPDAPYLRAEVVLAVRDEMARSVDDVARRRMPLSLVVPEAGGWRDTVAALIAEA